MNTNLLKAIGIGVAVFVIMMGLFWGIAYFYGNPLFFIPPRPAETEVEEEEEPIVIPDPDTPPFLL